MGYQVTGNLFHEIAGTVLFALFILHCILNRYWFINFRKIPKGIKGNLTAVIGYAANILLICHWKGLLMQMYHIYGISPDNKPAKITGRIAAFIIAVLGIYSSFEQGIGSKFIYSPKPDVVQPSGTVPDGAQETVPPESRDGSGRRYKGGRHGSNSSNSNSIQDLRDNIESDSISHSIIRNIKSRRIRFERR